MKKSSKAVTLVLITSVLASCNKQEPKREATQQVYMRADSTAKYTNVTDQYQQSNRHYSGSPLLWYMAFRHLGGGMGYGSAGLHPNSVSGTNATKAKAYSKSSTRGGFGKSAYSKTSSFSSGS